MAEITEPIKGTRETTGTIATGWRAGLYGLGAALCWSISPIFIRKGLEGLASPLLGVTVGMMACALSYGAVLLARRGRAPSVPIPREALLWQVVAGALVGLSTWARWIALDLAEVAVVVALGRISVPVVLVLSPFLIGRRLERVTARVWLGAGFIVAGSLILVYYR